MFQGSERLVKLFADRFEPDGADFLYRKNLRAAPIRVTADERDAFLADFRKAVSWAYWVLMGGTVVSIIGLVFLATIIPGLSATLFIFLFLAFFFAIYMGIYQQASDAPSVALRTRAAAGPGKSREEARAIMLAKLSWRRLGVAALAFAAALLRLSLRVDLTAGWNRLWLVGAAALYGFVGYRAYQKLRYGAAELPPSPQH